MIVQVKDALQCPICGRPCRDEDELDECVESCLWQRKDDTMDAWRCCKCGRLFEYDWMAQRHAEECEAIPDLRVEAEGNETCLSCAHGDVEGRRYEPCPEYNFAPAQKACEHYARAEK